MTKGLPYEIFMKQIIFEITERGHLHQLHQKWELPRPDCGKLQRSGNPLSWQKLISVFIIVIIGIFTAFVLLFIEKLIHYLAQNSVVNSKKCPNNSVKEANKIKLQNFFNNIMTNVNTDHIIQYSTMRALHRELQNYNTLLNESKNPNVNDENLWYLRK